MIVQLFSKREFDFTNVPAGSSNNTIEIPVARAIDCSAATLGPTLFLRCHSFATGAWSGTAQVDLIAYSMDLSPDDSVDFVRTTANAGIATLGGAGGVPVPPALGMGQLAVPWGGLMLFRVKATKPTSSVLTKVVLSGAMTYPT
jgi:hypothetical protein